MMFPVHPVPTTTSHSGDAGLCVLVICIPYDLILVSTEFGRPAGS